MWQEGWRTPKRWSAMCEANRDIAATQMTSAQITEAQVLTSPAGRPWRIDTFRHEFKKACRAAGVPEHLHFHDLRGSALKAFADAGCSELELRAISGHSMKSMSGALSSYIDAFRSLAESAVRKRELSL